MSSSPKRLYRSRENRQIAGVCGGLADYFNLDVTLIRLIFLAMLFLGGPGFLIYIIMAVVVPDEPRFGYDEDKAKNDFV